MYKWVEGTTVHDYADAGIKWGEHTNDEDFAAAFLTVVGDARLSNEARSSAVESFLLDQAVALGVVKKTRSVLLAIPTSWARFWHRGSMSSAGLQNLTW